MPGEHDQSPAGHIPGLPPTDQQLVHVPNAPLPADTVQQIVANQAREIGVREQELALETVKVNNAYDYSKDALQKQSAFYMQEATYRQTRFKWAVAVILFFGVLIAAFLTTLALTGHEAMAKELFKDVGLFLTGGAGGWGISNRRSLQAQQQATSTANVEE